MNENGPGYYIIGEIGSGSMLLADDELGNRRVLKPYKTILEDCFSSFELEALQGLNHENILPPLEIFYGMKAFYAVYDYFDSYNFEEYVKKKGGLLENEACHIIRSIINGYIILRNNNLFHGNIKPRNILIEKGEKLTVKLTDFLIKEKESWRTEQYCSPERVSKSCPPNVKSDIWSIGAVMRFILENTKKSTDFFVDLMKQCLEINAHDRIAFGEIIAHPCLLLINSTKKFFPNN